MTFKLSESKEFLKISKRPDYKTTKQLRLTITPPAIN